MDTGPTRRPLTRASPADSIVSDLVWFGFLLTALATIALAAVAVRRAFARRRAATA